jgi:hypothetical protein
LARVSTFCTSVERPCTPRSKGRSTVGFAGPPLCNGALECGEPTAVGAAGRQEDLLGADQPCRGDAAVDHEVRIDREEGFVLRARRLAFRSVRDDDRRATAADRAQLRRGGEAGAAAAGEAARLDLRKQLLACGGARECG